MAAPRHGRQARPVDHDDDLNIDYEPDEVEQPAHRSRVTRNGHTDDLPDEDDDQATQHHDNTYAAQTGSTAGLSLEELNKRTVDDQRDEIERAKIDPPRGDWLKTSRFNVEVRTNGLDKMPGDIDPAGRTFINFSGYPETRTVDGQSYDPMLFIRLSPDLRYKEDDPTKHDNSYKMWLYAKDLYLEINERKMREIGDIVMMMTDEEYIITTIKGDNGPIPIALKHRDYLKRRQRRNR